MLRFLCALILAGALNLSAGENIKLTERGQKKPMLSYNNQRFELMQQAEKQSENKNLASEKKKYILKSALFSALIPGAGQAYQKSYWKAALFFGLEAGFWTANIMYNKKGKDEDTRMRTYGDVHWSEQKYWSKIYDKVKADDNLWGSDKPQITLDENQIIQNYTAEVIAALRLVESSVGTHTLPVTKTQQYYEMIYKYLHQFGVGWDDIESFDYYDNDANMLKVTPHIAKYRSMRNRSNDFYGTADTMFIMSMVNHLVSMFEAAYSGNKNYNKVSYSFRAKPVFSGSEYTAAYGLSIIW